MGYPSKVYTLDVHIKMGIYVNNVLNICQMKQKKGIQNTIKSGISQYVKNVNSEK